MEIHNPSLVAVWPGMGGVAISAGYYLMAKLGMHLFSDFPSAEFFDLEKIEVENGLIQSRRLPRNRLFLWSDPNHEHDLILFIGEAQPPVRGADFCRQLIERARRLGVREVFTFAAMATQMRPADPSRVFCAAIDRGTLARFQKLGATPLETGTINGLNGVLLNMAGEHGLPGGCLLGEIPLAFSQFPFPKASLAVLQHFSRLADITIDFQELAAQAKKVDATLENFLTRIEGRKSKKSPEPEADLSEAAPTSPDRARIEELFREAKTDRSRAYELKQELDRLNLFPEYEDRFLDLFKNNG